MLHQLVLRFLNVLRVYENIALPAVLSILTTHRSLTDCTTTLITSIRNVQPTFITEKRDIITSRECHTELLAPLRREHRQHARRPLLHRLPATRADLPHPSPRHAILHHTWLRLTQRAGTKLCPRPLHRHRHSKRMGIILHDLIWHHEASRPFCCSTGSLDLRRTHRRSGCSFACQWSKLWQPESQKLDIPSEWSFCVPIQQLL